MRPILLFGWIVAAVVNTEANDGKPHLAQAVETIRKQAEWFGPSSQTFPREFLYGLATMNYVQSRLSPLNYSILAKAKKRLPRTPEECLSSRAGLCGSQVQTFLAIAQRLGLRVRPVEFYLRGPDPSGNRSHIAVEVYYNKRWHFLDVTWGTFFRRAGGTVDDLMSWADVRRAEDVRNLAVTNQSDLWYQQTVVAGHDPLEYLDWREMDVLVGQQGTIHLRPAREPKTGSLTYTPTHQPNYVGRHSAGADYGPLEFRLVRASAETRMLSIEVLGLAGSGTLRVEGEQGMVTRDLKDIKAGRVDLDLSGLTINDELQVRVVPGGPSKVGYVVFKRLVLHLGKK